MASNAEDDAEKRDRRRAAQQAKRARRAEAAGYAQLGMELALSWRLYDTAHAEMEADLRKRAVKQSPFHCRKCKLHFLNKEELRTHKAEAHDDFIPKPYVGKVINPMHERSDAPCGKYTLRDLRRGP